MGKILTKKLEGVFEIRKRTTNSRGFPGYYICPDGEHELINSLTVGKGVGEVNGEYIDRIVYEKAKEMDLVPTPGNVPLNYNLTITVTINPTQSNENSSE